jgi:hypothetical protein
MTHISRSPVPPDDADHGIGIADGLAGAAVTSHMIVANSITTAKIAASAIRGVAFRRGAE